MILECLGGKKKYLDIFRGRSAFALRDSGVTSPPICFARLRRDDGNW
jgi:hypothetical protein